jgi:putative YhbY family RNA-binding protein
MSPLTARERSFLKARAHPLEPIVTVGHDGLTEAVLNEIDRALTAHELIKVRVNAADRTARRAMFEEIGARTDAEAVQQVGKVLVLWRPRPLDAA